MPSMKAIKRRRSTVKNIQQITKAMNLVATSKLQRAKNHRKSVSRPVLATFNIAYNTLNSGDVQDQLYVARRKVKTIAYVLISSDNGLRGSYNSSVCKELARHARENGKDHIIIPIGSKGRDYFRRRNHNVADFTCSDIGSFESAKEVSALIMEKYKAGEVDEVFIVYTKFVSILNLEPVVMPILPINTDFLRTALNMDIRADEQWNDLGFFSKPDAVSAGVQQEVEYEPGLDEVLQAVIPWYLGMFLYAAMASSLLCMEAARMTSMDSATNNAGDIIEKLTLMFNRQRQSIITQEITEIVSGANALQ